MNFRHFALSLCFIIFATSASAQIRVFSGNGHYFTDMVLRLDNNRTLPPFGYSVNDAFYTVVGNKIMKGPMGSEFDLVYTVRDNKLYTGQGMYTSQIAYTFADDKIYRGDSNFELDVLYNFRENVIYAGSQSFSTDALFLVEGEITLAQLFAIMLSLDLLA